MENDNKTGFWKNCKEEIFNRVMKLRNKGGVTRTYKTPLDLDKAFIKKLEDYYNDDLTKTDVINTAIVEFVYGNKNKLTAKEAMMIIAKKKGVTPRAAKIALKDGGIDGFIEAFKEQCDKGLMNNHIDNYGISVVNAILDHK